MEHTLRIRTVLLLITIFFANQIFSQQNNEEFRSTWVITWEYISSSGTVDQKKEKIRKILDDHKKANMTSVLWQVRQSGTAYYNSSFEPWGSYAGGTYPGFDPLQYAIEEAHKRGLELHAWFNVFASGSLVQGTPAQQHPEWICRDQSNAPMTSNIALSPGLPAVQNYILNVAMEVVNNYDIDGLHLDYIRWNEYSSAPNAPAQKEDEVDGMIPDEQINFITENPASRYLYDVEHPFSAGVPSGFSSWEEWWRWSVTDFVRRMHDSIQTVKPYVRLSVAALGKYNWSGWNGYSVVYQDAALWFNQGYIDQMTAMHYHWTTGSGFYGMLTGSCPQCWSQFIQPGINAGRLYSVGPPSYILSDQNIWNNHVDIVNTCRNVDWVDGFQFFSYGSWRDKDYFLEASQKFFAKKTKIRDTKLILDTIPDAPHISLLKLDSLHYKLTVTPHASINADQWFAVYRSEDSLLDVNSDAIVDIFFGDSILTVNQTFDGLQNFNKRYFYFATMLDRYWNESLPSNVVNTDPIPSFAPKILSSVPTINDTVSIYTQLKFSFSKEMMVSTFPNCVTVNPTAQLIGGTWSDNFKTVTYSFSSPLNFATNYTVTIDSSAKDFNGVAIDGNGDGVPGDPFILSFRTEELDNVGPTVVHSFPDSSTGINQFDAEDVISILFDEILNSSTINATNINLKRGSNSIGLAIVHYKLNNRSLINIKAGQTLVAGENYSLILKKELSDTYGNMMVDDVTIPFSISVFAYEQKRSVDDFSVSGYWKEPSYSGSTVGIVDSGTYFAYSTNTFLPGTAPASSAYLNYQWNPSATTKLIREYLSTGPPRDVTFDTSNVLQVYLFGDGSGNKFRFALDEGDGVAWPNHEVSNWLSLNWYGWRLVEWQLNDPLSVGSWIGNGKLDYPLYRIDSFQMTDNLGSINYGRIYFDNLRVVKKAEAAVGINEQTEVQPNGFHLYQNYPNPFNPSTIIRFDLKNDSYVTLKVFDILGREVATLINNEFRTSGRHDVEFTTSSASTFRQNQGGAGSTFVTTNIYFYRLTAGDFTATKKLMFIK